MTTQSIGTEIFKYRSLPGIAEPENPKKFQRWILNYLSDNDKYTHRTALDEQQWEIVWLIQESVRDGKLITKKEIDDKLVMSALKQ